MIHHKHSFYPVVVASVTLALLLFMVYAIRPSAPASGTDPLLYQTHARTIVVTLVDDLAQTTEAIERLRTVESAFDEVLALTVPKEFQSLQLELAFALNLMKEGVLEDTRQYDKGYEALEALMASHAWLTQ